MRLTQSLFPVSSVRLECYVDDPLASMVGSRSYVRRTATLITLVWLILGFPLAFLKAQFRSLVEWIGSMLDAEKRRIVATVKESTLKEIEEASVEILSHNCVAVPSLRSYAGKTNHVASLIYTWRPFLQEIWGALASQHLPSGAPPNCIWVKQIRNAVLFILAFVRGQSGSIERIYTVEAYLGRGQQIIMRLDASPWGLGATLEVDGRLISWFSSDISEEDEVMLGHKVGESEGQQTFECLVMLVALREWSVHWMHLRAKLEVRGDNVAALTMAMHLKASGRGPSIIARELAFVLGNAEFRPDVVAHVPGVANVLPDLLSRLSEPGKKLDVPSSLLEIPRLLLPPRGRSYYRTLLAPCAEGLPRCN